MNIHFIVMAMLLTCLRLLSAESGVAESAESFASGKRQRDLAAAAVEASTSARPIWNQYAKVQRRGDGGARIVPPASIVAQRFAQADFAGDASWVGFDTLVLRVRCDDVGQLDIMLYEHDGDQREAYNLRIEELAAGEHTLRFTLREKPHGDLRAAIAAGDGRWNPDDQRGVQLLLADYPRGFVVEAMTLEAAGDNKGGK